MLSTVNKAMLVITIVVCVGQLVYWFGRLPDPMPSDFDVNGQVDGHMSKSAFFAVIGMTQFLFLVGLPLLGKMLSHLPDSMLNIPHKDYWLAPDRRESTLSISLAVLIASSWLTGWLMIGVFQLTAQVGLNRRETINPDFVWMLGGYLVAVFGLVIWMLYRFRRPENDALVSST